LSIVYLLLPVIICFHNISQIIKTLVVRYGQHGNHLTMLCYHCQN